MPESGNKNTYSTSTIIHWIWLQFKENRLQATLNILTGIGLVILDLLFVWATKLTIDIATNQNDLPLYIGAVILVAIVLIQIIISFSDKWIRAILGVRAQNKMQRKIFAHIMDSEWILMEKYHSGDVLNRIEKDVSSLVDFITESIPSIITILLKFIGAFVFLFLMDKTLACIIVVLVPTFILISKLYIKKMRKLSREVRQSDSKIQSIIQESIQHRTVIKTLEQTPTLISRLSNVQNTMHNQVKHRTRYSAISATIMSIGFATGYLFTFIWGTVKLEQGLITYGALMAFIQLVGQIQGPARSLTSYIPVIISTFTSTERILELQEIPDEKIQSQPILKGGVGIRFENVNYFYDPQQPIFHNFNYEFHSGQITAVMGETGVGKTTLIRLMLSLVQPQSGQIKIFNQSEDQTVTPFSRRYFSYIPQGNTLFSGTIRSNLLLGSQDATEEQLEKVLHIAAADFVLELPDGLDTTCGEQGFRLSEGQAQRICIARSLLRQSPILILDESTSSLDIATEKQVLQNISKEINNRTIIVISHRKAILEYCENTLKL